MKAKIPEEVLRGISANCYGKNRTRAIKKTAVGYGLNIATVYRALQKYEGGILNKKPQRRRRKTNGNTSVDN